MLQGDSIRLIPLEEKHLQPLRALRNSPETSPFLTSIMPVNESGQRVWFQNVSLDTSKMYFAVEDTQKKFIGFVRCDEWDRVNGSIRIGVDIVPQKRRQGYATSVYRLLLTYLFHQLRIHRIWLLVLESNIPAMNLYKKIGFKKEGIQRQAIFRNNRYQDYVSMSILAPEYGNG